MTSQFSFGVKNKYTEQLITFYDGYSIIEERFAKYLENVEDAIK